MNHTASNTSQADQIMQKTIQWSLEKRYNGEESETHGKTGRRNREKNSTIIEYNNSYAKLTNYLDLLY